MQRFLSLRRVRAAVGGVVLVATLAVPAHAADRFWHDTGGDNLWSTPANWDGGVIGGPGDVVLFTDNFTTNKNVNLDNNRAVHSVSFQSDTNYSISGGSFLVLQGGFLSLHVPAGGGATHTINSLVRIQADSTWLVEGANTLVINGAISHEAGVPNSLTKTGNGTLALRGDNSAFAGDVFVNDGTLEAGVSDSLGDITKVTVASGATLRMAEGDRFGSLAGAGNAILDGVMIVGVNNDTTTFSGSLSGAQPLTKRGLGTMTLSGNNSSFTGNMNVEAGTLEIGVGNSVGSVTEVIVSSGATLRVAAAEDFGGLSGAGNVVLNAGAAVGFNNNNTIFSGVISGSGSFQKSGTGTMTLSGSAPNTNTWFTTVADGTLQLSKNSGVNALAGPVILGDGSGIVGTAVLTQTTNHNIPDTTDVFINSDGLWIVSTETVDDVGGSGVINLGNLTVGADNGGGISFGGGNTFSGRLQGFGGTFTKTGTGMQTLSGAFFNTHTGLTKINNGTLKLSKNSGVDAMAGNVQVGDGIGNAESAILNQTTNHNIPDTSDVEVLTDGRWSVSTETVDAISGAGVISLGNLTVGAAGGSGDFSGTLEGTGTLTKTGAGTQTLTGNNSYEGGTTVSGGKLVVNTNSLPASNGVADNATLEFNQTALGTYAGVISGSGQLVKTGGGMLILNQTNTLTGVIEVHDGTLEVGSNAALGSATVSMFGGGIRAGAAPRVLSNTLDIYGSFTLGRVTDFVGAINLNNSATIFIDNPDGPANFFSNLAAINDGGGARGLTIADGPLFGAGIGGIRLTGVNTYTGGTTVDSGRLVVASTGSLAPTGAITINAGELKFENATQTVSSLSGTGGSLVLPTTMLTVNQSKSKNFLGNISGAGGLTKSGSGTVLNLLGENTYTGPTAVQQGTLDVSGASERLPNGTAVTVDSGASLRFFLGVGTETIGSLSGQGFVNFGNSNAGGTNLRVGDNNDNTTFSGRITEAFSGTGSLTKIGTGTFTLTNANTYTGPTTIDAGTLLANNTTGSATGTGGVTINSGGTLGGTGSAAGTTTVNAGGTVAPGASVGTLGLGAAVFEANSTLAVELAASGGVAGTDYDQVNVTSDVSLAGELDIVLAPGFTPDYFNEFIIVTAAARSGEFDEMNGLLINSNMTLAPLYDYDGNTGLTLVAAIPGDANLDGIVNGLDLLTWQANLFSGDGWDQGDFNLDGLVNGLDLLVWQSHLFDSVPSVGGSPAAAASVPEPGTGLLIVFGGSLLVSRRRRVDGKNLTRQYNRAR